MIRRYFFLKKTFLELVKIEKWYLTISIIERPICIHVLKGISRRGLVKCERVYDFNNLSDDENSQDERDVSGEHTQTSKAQIDLNLSTFHSQKINLAF